MHKFEIKDEAWASEFQAGLSNYIDSLLYSIDDEDTEIDPESGEAFCGCDVCYWREVLFYATPRLLQASKEGKISLTDG